MSLINNSYKGVVTLGLSVLLSCSPAKDQKQNANNNVGQYSKKFFKLQRYLGENPDVELRENKPDGTVEFYRLHFNPFRDLVTAEIGYEEPINGRFVIREKTVIYDG